MEKSKWFDRFLESFPVGEIYGQYGWLKPWQYKQLMKLAEEHNWHMISSKQLDCFMRNIQIKHSAWEEFGNYENDRLSVSIRISNTTGFAIIKISRK